MKSQIRRVKIIKGYAYAIDVEGNSSRLFLDKDGSLNVDDLADASFSGAKFAIGSITHDKLAASGVSAGTYGSNILIPVISVNEKGQVTGASTATARTASATQSGLIPEYEGWTTGFSSAASPTSVFSTSSPGYFAYSRIGNIVHVQTSISGTNTTPTAELDVDTSFSIQLPYEAVGNNVGSGMYRYLNSVNDTMPIQCMAGSGQFSNNRNLRPIVRATHDALVDGDVGVPFTHSLWMDVVYRANI